VRGRAKEADKFSGGLTQEHRILHLFNLVDILKRHTHLLFLLISLSLSFPAFAIEEGTYLNGEYSFTLEYPKTLKMRVLGGAYFDILKDGNIVLQASVEDDTFKIFIQEAKPEKDIFRSFARQRCKIICDADGPDGSTYCKELENEKEWVSQNGLRVLEFTLIFIREDYQNKTKGESRMGPVYVVNISRVGRPLALMIHPGHETLATKDTEQVIHGLIDTIKLHLGNSDRQRETKVCSTTCEK